MIPCPGSLAIVHAVAQLAVVSLCYSPDPGDPPWPAGSEYVTLARINGTSIPMPLSNVNVAQVTIPTPTLGDKLVVTYHVCKPGGVDCTIESPPFRWHVHGDWDSNADGRIGGPDYFHYREDFSGPEFFDFRRVFGKKLCPRGEYIDEKEVCP